MDAEQPKMQYGFDLLSIHCSTCGAPATYDIVKHTYACAYCGSTTSVSDARQQKKGFRKLCRKELREHGDEFRAVRCTCSGCGAEIAFPENEVLQSCSFCGRALVRGEYLKTPEFPELIIPFRLTPDEARECFQNWCSRNAGKPEAKHLQACLGSMQGYYLPYELVRGPIECSVTREGASRKYECGGFLTSVFVNTSAQLDNLTLNGMEPYDLRELRAFEFGYLAQRKAKVDEIGVKELDARVKEEVAASYGPVVCKALETKNVDIAPQTADLMRLPVLLPVYYVSSGNVRAAVNGQTGKVAVRCEKVRKTMPWWVRPIAAMLIVFAVAWAIATLLAGDWRGGMVIAGAIALVMGLIFYTAYSNAHEGEKRKTLDPKIFASEEVLERAPDGSLRMSATPIVEEPVEPVFFERVEGATLPVRIRFTTPARMAKMVLLVLAVVCLPWVIAFLLNGCSAQGLQLAGSAVWLCITVPVSIAYFVKFGRIDIYEKPYVYVADGRGGERRVKTAVDTGSIGDVLKVLLAPPLLWLVLAMALFLVMGVYLTLGN